MSSRDTNIYRQDQPDSVVDSAELTQTRAERDALAQIVDTAHDGIIGLDLDGTITSWNKGAEKLYGYGAAKMIGQHMEEWLEPPELAGESAMLLSQACRGEMIEQFETRRLSAGGKLIDVAITLSPITNTDGTIIGVSKIVHNITERCHTQYQLRESQRRLQALLDTVQLIAVMIDFDGRISYCNDYFLKLVGYERKNVIGGNWFELFIPPGARTEVEGTHSQILAGQPQAAHHENEILTRGGDHRLIRWDNTLLRAPDGTVEGSASLGTDITEYRRNSDALRASERRFRALIENTADIIATTDFDGTVRFISESVRSIAGYCPEDLIGSNFLTLMHPDDREEAISSMALLRDQPGQSVHLEQRYLHKDGSWLTSDVVACNQMDTPGIDGIVVTMHDVTALRQNHRMLTERIKEQRCLYKVSELTGRTDLNEETLLRETPALLSEAFQWPEISRARIRFSNHSYATPGFAQTLWRLEVPLRISGSAEGLLELCYIEAPPHSDGDEGPFLAEERQLVKTVAALLCRAIEALRAQTRLRQAQIVIESSPSVLFRWQAREGWPIEYVSDNVRLWGYSPEELLSGMRPFAELVHPDDLARIGAEVAAYIASGAKQFSQEYRIVKPSGEVFWIVDNTTIERDAGGDPLYFQGVVTDITERKQAELEIHRSHSLIESILNTIPVQVFWKDLNLVYLGCNAVFARDAGFSEPSELIGKTDDAMAWREHAEQYRTDDRAVIDSGEAKLLIEESQTTPDGRLITLLTSKVPLRDADGAINGILGTYMDITEHKLDLQHLQLFRELIDQAPTGIEVVDPASLALLDVNDTTCVSLGYSREELLSMHVTDIDPLQTPSRQQQHAAALADKGHTRFESLHRCKDGSTFPVEVFLKQVELDRPYIVVSTRDLTERRRYEHQIARVNRALKTLSAGNSAVVHASTEEQILQRMCDVVVDIGGYSLAWVGYAEQDEARSVRPVVWAGQGADYVTQTNISWAETERGQGPCGRCIRSGEPVAARHILTDLNFAPWRKAALEHGYQSCLALPLTIGDSVFGALMIYSAEADAFGADEEALLTEMAGDLSYGIAALRIQTAHEEGLVRLARSLDATVEALAHTVELRDPYTAGHQFRVAEIAVAIAGELALSEERVRGLRLAASIHDIGKISVPAEILAKPTKLNAMEYALIQNHAQAGFELLKGIDFPWPVAEMIRQHHERIDGSGYPQGLKGADILLEAKIMAVADVVESMSSHRPYRPSKGIDAALEEIARGRGTLFDEGVVDACLTLFRERGFSLIHQ